MVSINDLGVDINSNWSLNDNGDLNLISDEDNIVQSINNRLNCYYDSLSLLYDEYGSFLKSYLGWKSEDDTLEFINLEIEDCLNQDPRLLDNFEVTSDFNDDNTGVEIQIVLSLDDETDDELELNLILNDNGVTIEDNTDEEEE